MKRFTLQRKGTDDPADLLAEGVVFTSGWCVISWAGPHSLATHMSIQDVERVYGEKADVVYQHGDSERLETATALVKDLSRAAYDAADVCWKLAKSKPQDLDPMAANQAVHHLSERISTVLAAVEPLVARDPDPTLDIKTYVATHRTKADAASTMPPDAGTLSTVTVHARVVVVDPLLTQEDRDSLRELVDTARQDPEFSFEAGQTDVITTQREEEYRYALERIRTEYGRVCEEFDTCSHAACQSSYAAWQTASDVLGPIQSEVDREHQNTEVDRLLNELD